MNKINILAIGLVLFGVMTRLVPHPVNFTALTALALWAPVLFRSKTLSFIIPLFVMGLTDAVLGFHSTMIYVYGAWILIGLFSLVAKPESSWLKAGAASLSGSLLFFGITNFGVWTTGELYTPDFKGLVDCYVMAIPFLKNQILGDLLYTGLIGFGARQVLAARAEQAV